MIYTFRTDNLLNFGKISSNKKSEIDEIIFSGHSNCIFHYSLFNNKKLIAKFKLKAWKKK